MNEDRIIGAGREALGEAERAAGNATGSERLIADGIIDKLNGALQHGYGTAKDAISDAIDEAPAAFGRAADRGRDLGRQAESYVRRELGDNGSLYVLAGAAAILGIGLFAFSQGRTAAAPARQPSAARKPVQATAKRRATATAKRAPRKAPAKS